MVREDFKRSLIYVHGTNGSGKSTLARYLIMCAGGIKETKRHPVTTANVTYVHGSKLALLGKYHSPTGGADSIQPYKLVPETAALLIREGYHVFVEGLMSPGVETCARLHKIALKYGATYVRFIRLDIGFHKAQQNVLRRRMLTGNDKPFDPSNLRKKQNSCDGWFTNLAAAHLPVYGLNWEQSRDLCLSAYKLNTDGAVRVLDL